MKGSVAMHELLNTLYVTTDRAYLHLDHDTVRMEVGGETRHRMPLLHLGGIVCFGNVLLSPALVHRCAEDGRSVVLLDGTGRFKARIVGPTSGNVLLRQAQHVAALSSHATLRVARSCVAGKLQSTRQIVLRGARETEEASEHARLTAAGAALSGLLGQLEGCTDVNMVRGFEGEAAREYFEVFSLLVREDREAFAMNGRTRRPPLDRMNALLSFLYTVLLADCVAAAEGVGLDPQVGFLHVMRPGRPALGLDLMEELRSVVAERVALTLINRRQLKRDDFIVRDGGAVSLTDSGRKEVLVAYQRRKQDEVQHRLLQKKMPLGLVPHVQARLLARHLRGDVPEYVPFLYR
jgi:CRISPR-associated protein Cas1